LLHTLLYLVSFLLFFFTTPPTPELYTLSLHDALPIYQQHFDLLGIGQTVCATSNILALVEHEVPEHELIHLLELRKENLEIVERSEEHTSELQSPCNLVCRLLLEKKKKIKDTISPRIN